MAQTGNGTAGSGSCDGCADPDDDLDRLLDEYTAQATAEAQRSLEQQQRSQQCRAKKPAAVQRDEALAAPLPTSNKGYELLSKMGFKPGQGLGKEKQGRAEPIPVLLKSGRSGLGVEEAKRQRQREAELREAERAAKRQRRAAQAQEGFKGSHADAYAVRKLLRHARAAEAACRSLDERAGVSGNPLVPTLEDGGAGARSEAGEAPGLMERRWDGGWEGSAEVMGPSEESGGPAACPEEAEEAVAGPEAPRPVEELGRAELEVRLGELVGYLRSQYFFCVFCGTHYSDAGDMGQHCPGPGEEDHDE